MYEDKITYDVMTKFINSIHNSKKLFFSHGIVLLSRGKVLTDEIDGVWSLFLFLP